MRWAVHPRLYPEPGQRKWVGVVFAAIVLAALGTTAAWVQCRSGRVCDDGDPVDCLAQCRRGNARSCTRAARAHELGRGTAPNLARAAQLYRQGCYGEHPVACGRLGALYRDGRGVAPDDARAAELFERACRAELWSACVELGELFDGGRALAADWPRATALYRQGCQGGEPLGCSLWALMLELGWGVEPDPGQAEQQYRRACARVDELDRRCDAGAADACTAVASCLERGVEVSGKLRSAAAEGFQRGCAWGLSAACQKLELAGPTP